MICKVTHTPGHYTWPYESDFGKANILCYINLMLLVGRSLLQSVMLDQSCIKVTYKIFSMFLECNLIIQLLKRKAHFILFKPEYDILLFYLNYWNNCSYVYIIWQIFKILFHCQLGKWTWVITENFHQKMVYSPAYGNNGNLPTMTHLLGILNLMGEKVQILITEVQGILKSKVFCLLKVTLYLNYFLEARKKR